MENKEHKEEKKEISLIDRETNQVITIPRKKVIIRESLIVSLSILFVSLFIFVLYPLHLTNQVDIDQIINIMNQYKFSKPLLIHTSYTSLILILFINIILFLIRPSYIKPRFYKVSNIILFIIFNLLGSLAFIVLNQFFIFSEYKISMNAYLSLYLCSVIVLTYSYLIYKLFLENNIENKSIFYEIVRFTLTGLVAALADYLVTSLTKLLFPQDLSNNIGVVILSVTLGFTVGVIINYFLSVYMVYKASTNEKTKSVKYIIYFVVLSFIGMLIGYLIEILINSDLVFILKPYILVFIIRTIVVMIYNYCSRKFLIFNRKKDKHSISTNEYNSQNQNEIK